MFLNFDKAKNLKKRDVVVCPQRKDDLYYGWTDEMDEMVGIALEITDKTVFEEEKLIGITLRHPSSGDKYTFDHNSLARAEDLVKNKEEPVMRDGYVYTFPGIITTATFKGALKEDLDLFKEKVMGDEPVVVFCEELFEKMKKHSPRLIGFALCKNLLLKRKENEKKNKATLMQETPFG